jgi:teichuronic acid biosynthesis glycosyltransferase TuaG
MMASPAEVSVITPAYNAERFLEENLRSMQAQTFESWEQVLVDDGSSDRTVEIIEAFAASDPRFRLVRHDENRGVAAARNTGLNVARGRYVAFVDADDYLLPRKFERQIAFMREHGYAFTYHYYCCIDESGKLLNPRPVWMPESTDYRQYLCWIGSIGTLTVVLDREQTGPLEFKLVPAEDFALFLVLLKRFRAYGLMEHLARYRIVKSSLSSDKFKGVGWVWNVLRREEQLKLLESVRYMSSYMLRGIAKNVIHKRLQHRT